MGANWIRKLIGRSAPEMAPAGDHIPSGEVLEAVAELARLGQERPTLAGPAHFLGEALTGLFADLPEPATPSITREQALAKLDGGVPLLQGAILSLDANAFARRWQHVCAALGRHQEGDAAPAVAEALRRGSLEAHELTRRILDGHPEAVSVQADEQGLDAGLTATVLRLTLFPLLSEVNSSLADLRAGYRWERGYCPTCGSWPLLGEFRGLQQTRFLRCGLCAGEWEFPRLLCPFCATADHRQLGYFYAEAEEGKYRAATCAVCRGYVKMLSTLTALSPPRLLVADLATTHLDLVAADRGYEPGQTPAARAD